MPSCNYIFVLVFACTSLLWTSPIIASDSVETDSIEVLKSIADSLKADGYYDDALPIYKQALHIIAKKDPSPSSQKLRIANNIADCYSSLNKIEQCDSILNFYLALNQAQEHPDTIALAYALSIQAFNTFKNTNNGKRSVRLAKALEIVDRGLELLDKNPTPKRQLQAIHMVKNKCLLYSRSAKYSQCVTCLEGFRNRLDSIKLDLPKVEARYESLIGYALMKLYKYDLAQNHLKKSIELTKKNQGEFAFTLFYPLKNYSWILVRNSKYKQAIEYKKEAISIYEDRYVEPTMFLLQEKLNLAEVYIITRQTKEAAAVLDEVWPHLTDKKSSLYGFANILLARLQIAEDKSDEAETTLKRLLGLNIYSTNTQYYRLASHKLSYAYYKQKKYAECIENTDRLLDMVCHLSGNHSLAQYAMLAAIKTDAWDKAEELNTRNEDEIIHSDFTASPTTKFTKSQITFSYYIDKYKKFNNPIDLKNAIHYVRLLIDADKSNLDLYDIESRMYYHKNYGGLHDKYIEAFYLAYEFTKDDAFLAEASKFMDFQKSVTLDIKFKQEEQFDKATLKKIASKEKSISKIQDRLPFASDTSLVELHSQIFNHKRDITELKEKSNQQKKDFFTTHLAYENLLEGTLDSQTAILQIYNGLEKFHFILHSQSGTQYKVIETHKEFKKTIDRLIEKTQNSKLDSLDYYSHKIFAEIFDGIEIPENIQNLTIIPDRKLSFLPFEILKDNEGNYLLEKYNIQTSNSVKILYNQSLKKSKNRIRAMCFSPSYNTPNNAEMGDKQIAELVREGYFNLPGAIAESEKVHDFLGGKKFTHENAQESTFKELAKDHNVIHLAMHGLIDESDIMRSKLLFSNKKANNKEDNFLHAYEIMNMDLDADLVVLSACNTGLGELRQGIGVQSLANAFIYAGVSNTVMSLWKVPDSSTSILMENFYRNLKEGQAIHRALKNAKLEYLHDESISQKLKHPYYWAGFIANGNMRPLKDSPVFLSSNLLAPICLSLFIVIIFFTSKFVSSRAA